MDLVTAALDHGTERGLAYVATEWCNGVSVAVAARDFQDGARRSHDLVGFGEGEGRRRRITFAAEIQRYAKYRAKTPVPPLGSRPLIK